MRNSLLFGMILTILAVSLGIGNARFDAPIAELSPSPNYQGKSEPAAPAATPPIFASDVPYRGSVQVLNGCGIDRAAERVAEFLRSKKIDVKATGNAPTWNYPATMIISRTGNMSSANEIEKHMKTGKTVLIRNGDSEFDVTVIVGPDFEDKIR